MSDWRDIKTAPKDGRQFLAFVPKRKDNPFQCVMAVWCDDDPSETAWWCGDGRDQAMPSHWMPLPPPPAEVVKLHKEDQE